MNPKTLVSARWSVAAAAALLLTVPPCAAQLHSVMLGVPAHSEEALTWCGPATAEMIMEGYPAGACDETQADIWLSILGNKVETVWDTDPQGLRGALMDLCSPAPGGWSVYTRTDPDELMYAVSFWMTANSFPAALLMNTQSHNSFVGHQEHWVVIKGVVTDADPTSSSTVNLQYIWLTDPAVPLGDPPLERYISAATFAAEFQPVTKAASSYNGEYVAVIEPPLRPGRVRFDSEILRGRLIPFPEILRYVKRWVEELELIELGPFKVLAEAEPMKPLLVNPEYGGYYVVPFSRDGRTASVAVLVNAYTGRFQEVVTFAPRRPVLMDDAIEIAAPALHITSPTQATATLVHTREFGPRYLPSWHVETKGRSVIVGQDRSVREVGMPKIKR
jgi:hypothetical protein